MIDDETLVRTYLGSDQPSAVIVAATGVTRSTLYRAIRRYEANHDAVSRRKHLWEPDEDRMILSGNVPDATLAGMLDRTEVAIRSRRYYLNQRANRVRS